MAFFFDALANTEFKSTMAESVLRRAEVVIGVLNKFDVRRFFGSQSAAASLSKTFAMRVSGSF